jgi:hypothetical protein
MTALVQEHLAENYPGRGHEPIGRWLHAPIHKSTVAKISHLTGHQKPFNFTFDRGSPRHQPAENLHPTCNPIRKNQSLSVQVSSSLIMA